MIDKDERLSRANELIVVIASCGRRFFRYKDRVSQLERDGRGRIWLIDKFREKRIYTHYRYDWRGFSEGGTLRDLIIALRDFIVHGQKLNPKAFGPWPEWMCDGDLWGYGKPDMKMVRAAARRLEIVTDVQA